MKVLAEREAENLLQKEKFDIIYSVFISKKSELEKAIREFKFPIAMKVSGAKILHKKRIGGVKLNVKNYSQAATDFDLLMKIKNSEGVLLQQQILGNEFILGLKFTKDFGHAIVFGEGGTNVEKKRNVIFRICPLNEKEIAEMINEINVAKKLNLQDKNAIKKNIQMLCKLSEKYPKISELDINPLIVKKGKALVVDARMVFE